MITVRMGIKEVLITSSQVTKENYAIPCLNISSEEEPMWHGGYYNYF